MAKKTAILIYCTQEEREKIKLAASLERRTISGFVLNALMNRLANRERMQHPASSVHDVGAKQRFDHGV